MTPRHAPWLVPDRCPVLPHEGSRVRAAAQCFPETRGFLEIRRDPAPAVRRGPRAGGCAPGTLRFLRRGAAGLAAACQGWCRRGIRAALPCYNRGWWGQLRRQGRCHARSHSTVARASYPGCWRVQARWCSWRTGLSCSRTTCGFILLVVY